MAIIPLGSTSLIRDPSLGGYWNLNGNSNDTSGNGNNGTDSNITYKSGKIGQGANFNGSNSQIDVGNATTGKLNITGSSASFVCWYSLNDITVNNVLIWKGDATNTQYKMYVLSNGGGPPNGIQFNINSTQLNSTFGYSDSNWHHAAMIYDGVNMSCYIDGRFNGKTALTGNISNVNFSVQFGVARGQSNANAIIDDIAIFTRALTPAEIGLLAHGKRGATQGGGGYYGS